MRKPRIDNKQPEGQMVYDLSMLLWMDYGEAKGLDEAYDPCECLEFVIPVAVFRDEPAYVRNRYDGTFFIELKNAAITDYPLYPRGCSIPKGFQKDGLPVSVSGVVWDCTEYHKPNIRVYPRKYIKISTIKKL